MKYEKLSVAELVDLLHKKDEECAAHTQEIADLNEIIANAETGTAAASTAAENVEHEGEEYEWKHNSFRLPGDTTVHTAESAGKDPEVLKTLLAIEGQGVLTKVEAAGKVVKAKKIKR